MQILFDLDLLLAFAHCLQLLVQHHVSANIQERLGVFPLHIVSLLLEILSKGALTSLLDKQLIPLL